MTKKLAVVFGVLVTVLVIAFGVQIALTPQSEPEVSQEVDDLAEEIKTNINLMDQDKSLRQLGNWRVGQVKMPYPDGIYTVVCVFGHQGINHEVQAVTCDFANRQLIKSYKR